MKYKGKTEALELPDYFKFGIELEAFNVQTKGKNGLYTGESAKYITDKNWHMATSMEESLVSEGGAELVSPILRDTPSDWQSVTDMCEHIKKFPGNKGDQVIADDKCGLHVHFDSECLTHSPERMKNFLRIYAESEELVYKMCNDKNNPTRKHAINKDLKGIHLISSIWRNGTAAPTGKKILEQIENNTLKVSYKKFGKLKTIAGKLKLDERRYSGLNLTNIGNVKKNTIEFRMANGSLDPEAIKQTVFLYVSLIDTAIKVTENPEIYKQKLDQFYKTDVSEEEKAHNFLDLIMDSPEDKQIYINRWESVKDAPVYQKNERKGFAQNRFNRDQFRKIAERTPSALVQLAYSNIEKIKSRIIDKGDTEYDK